MGKDGVRAVEAETCRSVYKKSTHIHTHIIYKLYMFIELRIYNRTRRRRRALGKASISWKGMERARRRATSRALSRACSAREGGGEGRLVGGIVTSYPI